MRVDPGTDRRAAGRQLQHGLQALLGTLDGQFQLAGQAADLLAQPQRRGVHQVRAADLDDVVPLFGFVGQRVGKSLQGGNQVVLDFHGHRHVDRRGEDVVGALAHVDVVVRVYRLLRPKAVAAQDLDRPVGDHLVDVHVAGGAGTGLEHVDRKLAVVNPLDHLAASLQHGRHLGVVQRVLARSGQLAQVPIGDAAGVLDQAHGVDQRGRQGPAGDRKILHRALRLCAVVRLGGNLHFAHRVPLDAEITHDATLLRQRRNPQINRTTGVMIASVLATAKPKCPVAEMAAAVYLGNMQGKESTSENPSDAQRRDDDYVLAEVVEGPLATVHAAPGRG